MIAGLGRLLARLGSLLEEKRDPRDADLPGRWSASRLVVLTLAYVEARRLWRAPMGSMTFPESLFATSILFALTINWLMGRVRIQDIPQIIASFFNRGKGAAAGFGGGYGVGAFSDPQPASLGEHPDPDK